MNRQIIIFLPSFESGGVERNAVCFANGMVDLGYEVHLIYCRKSGGWFSHLNARVHQCQVARPIRLPLLHERLVDALNMFIFSISWIKRIRNTGPTAMISFQSNVVAIALARLYTVPVAVRLSNHFTAAHLENSVLRKISELIKRWSYKFSNIVIANSLELANDYQPILRKKVETIFNPIDFSALDRLRRCEVSEIIFTQKKRPIVISAGRLTAQKNYPLLLRAMVVVLNKIKCDLILLGEGSEKENLMQLARDLGVADHVHFFGYRDNVYRYFDRADLFVLSSNYEGMPNVLIEAIACGLPAVATQCKTGPSEILCDGDGGELIPIGDCAALADGIIRSLMDPANASEKNRIAQKNILRFDVDVVNSDYARLVERLITNDFS